MSVRQYVISDPANITYKQTQNDTTGMPSTVWQQQMADARRETQYIIHSDHPHTYIDGKAITTTPKLNLDPYKLSKIITLNTMTPSMAKTRTGTKNYMTKQIYNFETKITLQLTTRTTQTLKTTHCLGPSLIFGSRTLRQLYKK